MADTAGWPWRYARLMSHTHAHTDHSTHTGHAAHADGHDKKHPHTFGDAHHAIELLKFADGTLHMMMKNWPADKHCAIPFPHDQSLMWTVGHLATSADWFHWLMTGEPGVCPKDWEALFGMGSKPGHDPKMYPKFEDVMRAYQASVTRMTEALGHLTDEQMHQPVMGESHGMAKSRLDAAHRTAWHIGWHTGQLSTTRRGLGLGSAFGA